MGLKWLDGFPASESWCVLDGPSIREAVEARWTAMLRAALFTIMPQYLHDASRYSHRLTLVFRGPILLAFAFLNLETVAIPDVSSWSGDERLSFWAPSLSGIRKRAKTSDAPDGRQKAPRFPTVVAHLGAIGCSPHSTVVDGEGLGSRLMKVQKALAYQMLAGPVRLLALEAIKPLDTLYYGRFGFQTSTPSFWSVSDPVSLVPMVHKLRPEDSVHLSDLHFHVAEPVDRSSIVAEDGPWSSVAPVVGRVSDFLWRHKDPESAANCLKLLCRRLGLTELECRKLWSMRFHSLMYAVKGSMRPKDPLVISEDWFQKSLTLDDAVVHALSKALQKL